MGVLVSEFINFIGGTVRWIFGSIWRTVANKPKFTFTEYIVGPKRPDYYDTMGHRFNNILIGMIVFSLIISYFL